MTQESNTGGGNEGQQPPSEPLDPEALKLLGITEKEEQQAKEADRQEQNEPVPDKQPTPEAPARPSGAAVFSAGSIEQDDLDGDYDSNEEWKALLAYREQSIKVKNKQQNMQLRDRIAHTAIRLVIIQIFVSNVFFLIYLLTNLDGTNPNVMIAWLSASVIEVIGILLVVARSLFKPNRRNDNV